MVFLSDCCDPFIELDVVVSCPALGRLDISFVSTASTELTFDLLVGSIPPRQLTVAPGATGAAVVTGRADSVIPVELTTGGERVAFAEAIVNCAMANEATFEVSCVGGRGRIDVWFFFDGNGDVYIPLTVWIIKDQASYLDALDRSVDVRTGFPTRTTVTGREDGQYSIVWSTIGGHTRENTVTVACGSYEAPVTVEVSCLLGNGRIDVRMLNDGAAPETYTVVIGELSPRERYIVAGGGNRITATGRADGPIPVTVVRGDELIYDDVVTVDCPDLP